MDAIPKSWHNAGSLLRTFACLSFLTSFVVVYEKLLRRPLLVALDSLRNRVLAFWSDADALSTDPPLLKKHSTFQSFTTSYATYPSIRTFYHRHPQEEKLPDSAKPLPLIVCVHGLGGSMAQFAPLLGSLVNVAPCLGIDFPGCGLSSFVPQNWEAYSTEAMAALVDAVIAKYRSGSQGIILIGHSMGCSISAMLASKNIRPVSAARNDILGFVALCPRATPPTAREVSMYRKYLYIPNAVFNVLRWWDRRGGLESNSIKRITGLQAGIDTRKLQERFNEQSKTPVWRRMAWGALPTYSHDGGRRGGLPGREVWSGLNVPILLVAGEADALAKPQNLGIIVQYLRSSKIDSKATNVANGSVTLPDTSKIHDQDINTSTPQAFADDRQFGLQTKTSNTYTKSQVVKATILPSPASHALLYDHATYRTLAGLIFDFLSAHVSHTLSLGWQLQQLTTSGKWDVKNLAKWKGVLPVSEPIGPAGMFRALKTLREQDEEHTPVKFAKKWNGQVYALIDISHDSPIYNPAELEKGGIQYHKFPTVSKIPPTVEEVQDFIALVERLRAEILSTSKDTNVAGQVSPAIGIHCHYGYNRTGFFIVSYLIEKQGYRVQDAIDEFERQRAPGIRHDHFLDTLFVRHCVGLKRAPTVADERP
ncbi:MAG: hypothetical protein Q9227_000098 [Pyrenula ochraceoflavens]